MRSRSTWTAACVAGVIIGAGCVADVEDNGDYAVADLAEPELKGQQFRFSPSVFQFVVKVPDDGTDIGGGYQEAHAFLDFRGIRPGLLCEVAIGMPIRTAAHGTISPSKAADTSATVATLSSKETWRLKDKWVGEDFCIAWRRGMQIIFKNPPFKGMGAVVSKTPLSRVEH
jgi:hypothetical protein